MKSWAELSPKARTILIASMAAGGVFIVGVVCLGASLDWYFSQRVFPGVHYGVNHLGGLTRQEASAVLAQWSDEWWSQQLAYEAKDEGGKVLATVSLYPVVVTEGNGQSYELVWYDFDTMLDRAFEHGRHPNPAVRVARIAAAAFSDTPLQPIVEMNRDKLREFLQEKFAPYETQPQDAALANLSSYARPQVVAEQSGNTFDYENAMDDTESMLRQLRQETIILHRRPRNPSVTAADATKALESYQSFVAQFPVTITYDDPAAGFVRRWDVPWATAYQAIRLAASHDGGTSLALDEEKLQPVWAGIEAAVNIDAQDAKFEIGEDKRVKQFQPSRPGARVDRAKTTEAMNAWLSSRVQAGVQDGPLPERAPVALAVEIIEPQVSTENVNDLGVTEVLGVGYSNYSGSPVNRVHNISIGVQKLNGMLIKPGEEFSLLKALQPFTAAAGYRPELVIKGDKIEPEIGGGLCQIGSTTFRAAMNSGLQITERRNHSLVVSYYNDPRNKNPGTDATIYDPAPDLKFVNDTGNHILITTSMNYSNGDLLFTFWGTSDGRKAEYTEPVVSRWIPAGPEKLIETADLPPGEKKCQSSHVGAVASFTYRITQPNGEVKEQVFTSSYRPLPRICLIGVDPNAAPQPPEEPLVAPDGSPIEFGA